MTGSFELFEDQRGCFRFRITAPDGTMMALSGDFPDKRSAVAGIEAVREYAGMGLITDQCPKIPLRAPDAGDNEGTGRRRSTIAAAPEPSLTPRQTAPHLIGTVHAPQRTAPLEMAGAGHRAVTARPRQRQP
ncbi:YegP family protein [Arthrobacter sp. KN11-1C]|uniref:YegP family protein n=1 Tax=Arthrobacter sp. KN11-1C TaxID=3445774 RepID=UPI003FA170F2